jgi:serine phosphatase RsbU (regulator of sigma subunit)
MPPIDERIPWSVVVNSRPKSTLPPLTRTLPQGRFLLAWAVAWAVVGLIVALVIDFFIPGPVLAPALSLSILFAEVVGFTALVSARLVFPLFSRLPYLLFLPLQIITLISATVFGSILVVLFQPLFSFAESRTVGLLVLVNALLAVVVGIALHTYDSMRRQIEQSYENLRRQESLERELQIARDVQQELLPHGSPTIRGLDLTGICRPAIGVGGDYFDFIVLSEDEVGLAIGDVSGKGVPAALLMAGLHTSVRSLALPGVGPAQLNNRLNRILFRSSSSARYATFLFAFYDYTTRTFRYSNAGHHPPLLLRGETASRLDSRGGLPIGMFEDSGYGEAELQLSPGDLLALFTDGIVEAPDPAGAEYGEQRLIDLLCRHRQQPLARIVDAVLEDLERWVDGGDPHDDVTLVLARAR